jgi:hypothetical protein
VLVAHTPALASLALGKLFQGAKWRYMGENMFPKLQNPKQRLAVTEVLDLSHTFTIGVLKARQVEEGRRARVLS